MRLCTDSISFSLLAEVKSGGGDNVEEATRVGSLFSFFILSFFFWRFLTNVMPRWCAAHFNAHCYCHAHSSVHSVGEGGGGGRRQRSKRSVRSVGDGRAAITNC